MATVHRIDCSARTASGATTSVSLYTPNQSKAQQIAAQAQGRAVTAVNDATLSTRLRNALRNFPDELDS